MKFLKEVGIWVRMLATFVVTILLVIAGGTVANLIVSAGENYDKVFMIGGLLVVLLVHVTIWANKRDWRSPFLSLVFLLTVAASLILSGVMWGIFGNNTILVSWNGPFVSMVVVLIVVAGFILMGMHGYLQDTRNRNPLISGPRAVGALLSATATPLFGVPIALIYLLG